MLGNKFWYRQEAFLPLPGPQTHRVRLELVASMKVVVGVQVSWTQPRFIGAVQLDTKTACRSSQDYLAGHQLRWQFVKWLARPLFFRAETTTTPRDTRDNGHRRQRHHWFAPGLFKPLATYTYGSQAVKHPPKTYLGCVHEKCCK